MHLRVQCLVNLMVKGHDFCLVYRDLMVIEIVRHSDGLGMVPFGFKFDTFGLSPLCLFFPFHSVYHYVCVFAFGKETYIVETCVDIASSSRFKIIYKSTIRD
jgi:hypothetical protein